METNIDYWKDRCSYLENELKEVRKEIERLRNVPIANPSDLENELLKAQRKNHEMKLCIKHLALSINQLVD